jgi:hypothetical protein
MKTMKKIYKKGIAIIALLGMFTIGAGFTYHKTMEGISNQAVTDYMHANGYNNVYTITPDGDNRIVDTENPYDTYVFVENQNGIFVIVDHEDF